MNKTAVVFSEKDFTKRVEACITSFFATEGIDVPKIPIEVSYRMSRTLGYFRYRASKPVKLRFSGTLLNGFYTVEHVDEIIKHEVLHFLIFMVGHRNEIHGKIFKSYCRKYNCIFDGSSSKMERTELFVPRERKEKKFIVKCEKCGHEFKREKMSKIIRSGSV